MTVLDQINSSQLRYRIKGFLGNEFHYNEVVKIGVYIEDLDVSYHLTVIEMLENGYNKYITLDEDYFENQNQKNHIFIKKMCLNFSYLSFDHCLYSSIRIKKIFKMNR